jgi:hypothetical protein
LLLAGGATAQDAAAPAPDGKGRVIFYRTGGINFSGRSCPIFEETAGDATEIGPLGGGKYVAVNVAPGTHRFAASRKLKRPVQLEVVAGQTLYVRCQLSGFPGSPKLLASHVSEFERFAEDLEPSR